MKIGILGSPNAIETLWLEQEGKKRGHEITRFSTRDLSFKSDSKTFKVISKYNFYVFDIFLIRGIYRSYFVKNLYFNISTEAFLFLRYAHDVLNKPIVDERLATKPTILSKMATSLNLNKVNLPQPATFQFASKNEVLRNLDKIPYPVIIKNPAGRKGENMYKIDSKNKLEIFLKKVPQHFPFLFQQYLPTDGDIRILVIGDKVIGAMKRLLIPGDFRANISQGAKAEKFKLTDETVELAKKAAKATETEFAGVDLIESEGKFYVIEVNRAPQFRGFRKYTKVDPSPYVIDYLEKKAKDHKKK